MICPHCRIAFHDSPVVKRFSEDSEGQWAIRSRVCPTCQKTIVQLELYLQSGGSSSGGVSVKNYYETPSKSLLLWPKGSTRPPCPVEVPGLFAEDYKEACIVLPDSPKASAALSRRCLQNILREIAKVKPADLANEIQQVIDSKALPSHLSESIDAIRINGNFATHPLKSTRSGEILEVVPGEAEWNLDVLEGLFDFYFVQPALTKKKRAALDAKLGEAGKPPMK